MVRAPKSCHRTVVVGGLFDSAGTGSSGRRDALYGSSIVCFVRLPATCILKAVFVNRFVPRGPERYRRRILALGRIPGHGFCAPVDEYAGSNQSGWLLDKHSWDVL